MGPVENPPAAIEVRIVTVAAVAVELADLLGQADRLDAAQTGERLKGVRLLHIAAVQPGLRRLAGRHGAPRIPIAVTLVEDHPGGDGLARRLLTVEHPLPDLHIGSGFVAEPTPLLVHHHRVGQRHVEVVHETVDPAVREDGPLGPFAVRVLRGDDPPGRVQTIRRGAQAHHGFEHLSRVTGVGAAPFALDRSASVRLPEGDVVGIAAGVDDHASASPDFDSLAVMRRLDPGHSPLFDEEVCHGGFGE
ncbi:hypothetical protein D3C73_884360 [compost metagenome]